MASTKSGIWSSSIIGFAALLGLGAAAAEAQQFGVGKAFPRLAFPSLDEGKPISIASFRGQKLVLHIWASW
jgi:hypothetical protein